MFGTLLVINYFEIIDWIIFSMVFIQRDKLFECLVSSQFLLGFGDITKKNRL